MLTELIFMGHSAMSTGARGELVVDNRERASDDGLGCSACVREGN